MMDKTEIIQRLKTIIKPFVISIGKLERSMRTELGINWNNGTSITFDVLFVFLIDYFETDVPTKLDK